MDRSSLILAFATFALFFANAEFNEIAYFHPLRIILLNLLGLAAAVAFFIAYAQRGKEIRLSRRTGIVMAASLALFFALSFQLVGIAMLISVGALLVEAFSSKRLSGYRFYAVSITVIIIAFLLSYSMLYPLRGTNWKGVDEIAYNYYASYLLLHGTNPYTVSMFPIIKAHNITPTYLLNGSVETAYDYPAFSFLPVLFLGSFNLGNFISFIGIVVLVTIIVTFIIYKKISYKAAALLPIAAWLLVTYAFMGTIDHYISVALFLLLAYTERESPIISGIFMGLSASTIQLSWFALPFLFVLMYRENGKNSVLKAICIAVLTFLVVNSYFIAASPKLFIENIFGLFGTSGLLVSGTNIMQVLIRSYGVALWYPAVLSLLAFAVLITLFYLYTYTLKPLLAIAPAFIFMLSWHNFLMYSLPYVPLIILLCYEKESRLEDAIRSKSYILVALAALVAISAMLAAYSHYVYAKSDTISVNGASIPFYVNANNTYGFNGIALSVANNGNSYENVSFFFITEQNRKDGIFQSIYMNGMQPHSTKTYTLNYSVQSLTGNTRIYVMAFSRDYITGAEFRIDAQSGNVTRT